MQIELLAQPDAVIARWQELVNDPELARWPGKIETDRFGRTIMSPPPAFGHTLHAGKIIGLLNELLPDGRALPETPVDCGRHQGAGCHVDFGGVCSGVGNQNAAGAGARLGNMRRGAFTVQLRAGNGREAGALL